MRCLENGFTLIELMIVVAIIGILAVVAMPAYQDYTIRTKMAEVILALSACRLTISEVYQAGGTPPAPNGWGCGELGGGGTPIVTKYVSGLTTDANGVITATIQNINSAVNGKFVTLIPMADGSTKAFTAAPPAPSNMGSGLFGWVCGSTGSNLDRKYLPSSCRGI